jgi:hypothetical protein
VEGNRVGPSFNVGVAWQTTRILFAVNDFLRVSQPGVIAAHDIATTHLPSLIRWLALGHLFIVWVRIHLTCPFSLM